VVQAALWDRWVRELEARTFGRVSVQRACSQNSYQCTIGVDAGESLGPGVVGLQRQGVWAGRVAYQLRLGMRVFPHPFRRVREVEATLDLLATSEHCPPMAGAAAEARENGCRTRVLVVSDPHTGRSWARASLSGRVRGCCHWKGCRHQTRRTRSVGEVHYCRIQKERRVDAMEEVEDGASDGDVRNHCHDKQGY
jgi:hypothetical protein